MIEAIAEADQSQRVVRQHRRLRDLGHQRDVLARGEARNQVVELKHEADMLAAIAGQFRLAGPGELVVPPPGRA